MRTYPEEDHARQLHEILTILLVAADPETEVEISGAGVHWQCTANRGGRSIVVHCFDQKGPQYYARFRGLSGVEACGRTRSPLETIAAVQGWLDGLSRDEMHARFAHVDQRQRQLEAIRADSIAAEPELGRGATPEVRQDWSDFYELWFRSGDRSAKVSYYGEEAQPDVVLHWDGCEQIRDRTGDTPRRARMIRRWVCDRAAPSAMGREFPEARVDPVARFYEEGRPVEGEFLTSWDRIERSYSEGGAGDPWRFSGMIAAMRRAGYDRTLRAGQSMWTLGLSRSRRHGLREGQPCLWFDIDKQGKMRVRGFLDGPIREEFSRVEFTPEIDALLRRLAAKDVD